MSLISSKQSGCRLCKNISKGITEFDNKQIDSSPILFETDNFFLLPDISPVSQIHVLVVTKKHYQSMVSLPDYIINELDSIIKLLQNKLSKENGYLISFFEHGTLGVFDDTFNSVNHFHLHAIQCDNKLSVTVEKNAICKRITMDKLSDIKKFATKEYIFVQDNDGERYIYLFDKENIQSQFVRRIVFSQNDNVISKEDFSTYNWKEGIDIKRYNDTACLLKNIFVGRSDEIE